MALCPYTMASGSAWTEVREFQLLVSVIGTSCCWGTLLMRRYLWLSVGGELEFSKSENHRRIQSTEQKTHFLWDPLKCGPLGHVPLAKCCVCPWHGPIEKPLLCTKSLIYHFELFTQKKIGKFSTLFFLRSWFFDQNTTNGPLTHKFVHLPHLQSCTEFYNLMNCGWCPGHPFQWF